MSYDDSYIRSIPSFLRRRDSADFGPGQLPAAPLSRPPAKPAPQSGPHQADKGSGRPAVPPSPPAPESPAPESAAPESATKHPSPQRETANSRDSFFHSSQRNIEQAFSPAKSRGRETPFQVTLPREVVRQIRLRAAEQDTTHRAIVLKALREAGFAVPEGSDVDRRQAAHRRGPGEG